MYWLGRLDATNQNCSDLFDIDFRRSLVSITVLQSIRASRTGISAGLLRRDGSHTEGDHATTTEGVPPDASCSTVHVADICSDNQRGRTQATEGDSEMGRACELVYQSEA